MKINFIFEKMKSMINKTQTLDQSKSLLINKSLNNILNSNLIGLSKRFQEVNIDEI